jgi:integrase
VLTIERGVSAEQVGPTKTKQTRRLTLAASTVALWREYDARWRGRLPKDVAFGPWLFSRDLDQHRRLTAGALAHWFTDLCAEADITGVSLHRLRHTVATFVVRQGDVLGAQHRLGHREASTTLRNYVHALPLEDEEAADQIERALLGFGNDTRVGPADQADS